MITKWNVSNFKSIQDMPDLELGPLTIFAGANSSGKSTFIQSILLVAQTLSHKVSSRSVVLNGALTSLGQFDDLKSNGAFSEQISIKCTCRPIEEKREIFGSVTNSRIFSKSRRKLDQVFCEVLFDSGSSSSDNDLYQIQPRLFSTRLACMSNDQDNINQVSTLDVYRSEQGLDSIRGLGISDDMGDQFRESFNYSVSLDSDSLAELRETFVSAEPIGCMFRHFLPERIFCRVNTVKEDANVIASALQDDRVGLVRRHMTSAKDVVLSESIIAVLRDALQGVIQFDELLLGGASQQSLLGDSYETMSLVEWSEKVRNLPFQKRTAVVETLRRKEDLFEKIYDAISSSSDNENDKKGFTTIRVPQKLAESASYLDGFFSSSLKYLGPLRDSPKPLYPLAPAADPSDVGLRGEHTAFILDLHKSKKIRYIPSEAFEQPSFEPRQITRTLEAAVSDWLRYLDVAATVESQDKGKLGHELKVGLSSSDYTHDLTHVGVGVSQVLPILVMCLLAESDSTLVFEQPELHLHPKVQTLLGDFFLSIALSHKQCIVETHSEYLIDRLRFRIAASPIHDNLEEKTKIYFVEKPEQHTKFREVIINEYGAIPDWPKGFFDQSQQQAEEILKAALAKKKAKKNKE